MKLGTLVQDKYGNVGRITRLYDDFSAIGASCRTMTGEEWLARQNIPFTAEHLEEMWCTISIRTGGSCWSPLSCLTLLQDDGFYPEIT